jgi:hypothetical protein
MCDVPSTAVFVKNLLNAFLVLFPDIIVIVVVVVASQEGLCFMESVRGTNCLLT